MDSKTVVIGELVKKFNLKQIVGDENSLKRPLIVKEINRPAFELMGFFTISDTSRLILIGNKEQAFIQTLDEEALRNRFDFLTQNDTPGIIITQGNPCNEILIEIAKEKNFPLFLSNENTSQLLIDILMYLSKRMAPSISIHATFIEVYGVGVLLLGESGVGKSEISLELIKKGNRLIADDRVYIRLISDELIGSAPEILYGYMEVRGIGIIDVKQIFGSNSIKESERVDYAIKLVPLKEGMDFERLGAVTSHIEYLGKKIPMVELPVSQGRNMSDIVEVAVTNLKLKDQGIDGAKEFNEKLDRLMLGGKK
ncbi:TPA: HPr(Ser) kinase/phosphatase [bacterium]|jgi:HPr kinase/phosphorylase|nr:HPr(Ser) kinase/phosphatase [bacterium]